MRVIGGNEIDELTNLMFAIRRHQQLAVLLIIAESQRSQPLRQATGYKCLLVGSQADTTAIVDQIC